ncbi:MAG: chromate transporter [Paludibacteraceae bacterium]|nr:chromate transporter [Paludibacteraceae bacterium]
MIPLMEDDVVNKNHWLTKDEFVDMLAVVQSLPGPISVNISLFVGYRVNGAWGAILSLLGIVIPSFVIILLIAAVFTDFTDNPTVVKVFKGVRPAVVALIAAPIVRMYKTAGITLKNVWIPVVAVVLIGFLGVSPIWVILAAAVFGILFNLWRPSPSKPDEK